MHGGDSSHSWCANRRADVVWQLVSFLCEGLLLPPATYSADHKIHWRRSCQVLCTRFSHPCQLQCVYSSEASTCVQHIYRSCWCTMSRVISSPAPSATLAACRSSHNVQTVYSNVSYFQRYSAAISGRNSVKSVLTINCDLRCIRTTLFHKHTNVWLAVHFLLWDLLHVKLRCTSTYNSLCSHLKTCYFLTFIPGDVVFYSPYFFVSLFYY